MTPPFCYGGSVKLDRKLLIIGAGPAGLTAGMYAARARVETTVIEKLSPG